MTKAILSLLFSSREQDISINIAMTVQVKYCLKTAIGLDDKDPPLNSQKII